MRSLFPILFKACSVHCYTPRVFLIWYGMVLEISTSELDNSDLYIVRTSMEEVCFGDIHVFLWQQSNVIIRCRFFLSWKNKTTTRDFISMLPNMLGKSNLGWRKQIVCLLLMKVVHVNHRTDLLHAQNKHCATKNVEK